MQNNLVEKLRAVKDLTKEGAEEIIYDYSVKNLDKILEKQGINKNDLTEDEYIIYLNREIENSTTSAKAILKGVGAFAILELFI